MNKTTEIESRFPLASWYDEQKAESAEGQIIKTILSGISLPNIESFLHPSIKELPDPGSLKGIQDSVDLFLNIIQQNKSILIVGDYDVDGITSTVIFIRFLKSIHYENFDSLIPNRFKHGYGLTKKLVEEIIQKKPDLVITVDNGITSKIEIAQIKRNGIDIIVTDHHLPQEGVLPDCLIVNPKQAGCLFPYKDLAGVGVAYMFIIKVRATLRKQGFWDSVSSEPNLLQYLDLVAIGTIADQVPLLGLNRVFVRMGLEQMTRKSQEPNLDDSFHYLKIFSEKENLRFFNSETIAFRLAPMLNATGRMKDAIAGVNFLISDSAQNAINHYKNIEKLNQKRRKKQKVMLKKAMTLAKTQIKTQHGLVLFDESFHEGLIGIIASRIVDEFKVPCAVITKGKEDILKASCRSKDENIIDILEECQSYLERFGGHTNAAGFSIKEEKLSAFTQKFSEVCLKVIQLQNTKSIRACIEVKKEMLTFDLINRLKILEPYGQENRKPVFLIKDISLPVPTIMTGKHLKWTLDHDLELIYWNGKESVEYDMLYDITFTLEENTFRGVSKRQLILDSIISIER